MNDENISIGESQDVTQGSDRDFVEYVVKQLVEKPEQVKVSRSVDEMGILISLEVAIEDMGKIIGKNGQTAKSLRILLRVIGAKNNSRVNLKIIEPAGSTHPRAQKNNNNENDADLTTEF